MKKRIENIIHIIIVITTVWAIAYYFNGSVDLLGSTGSTCFRYFTTDSNVLACLASFLCLLYYKKDHKPKWLNIFQFVSVIAVSITFLIVLFFLIPMTLINGGGLDKVLFYYSNNIFVLHFSTPVLSFITLLLQNKKDRISKKEIWWALLPVIVYSIVYLVMVVFVGKWTDWYGFTFGGHYEYAPISMIAMYLITYLISLVEWKIQKN